MQHSLAEREQAPGSLEALPVPLTGKESPGRFHNLRLYFYLIRGVILIALTCILFHNGVQIISKNAKQLMFYALNFNVPLPFLLIGLWGLVVLTLAILSIANTVKIYRLLTQSPRYSARTQRKAA